VRQNRIAHAVPCGPGAHAVEPWTTASHGSSPLITMPSTSVVIAPTAPTIVSAAAVVRWL
jgi:hypothetical protein